MNSKQKKNIRGSTKLKFITGTGIKSKRNQRIKLTLECKELKAGTRNKQQLELRYKNCFRLLNLQIKEPNPRKDKQLNAPLENNQGNRDQ